MSEKRDPRAGVIAAMEGFSQRVKAGKVPEPKPKRKKRTTKASGVPLESVEQAAVVTWLRKHGIAYTATLNGAHLAGSKYDRAAKVGAMYAQGMVKGTPDLIIYSAAKNGKPTALEMKALDGTPSDEQRDQLKRISGEGWNTLIGYGHKDAIEQLRGLGYAK